MKHKFKPFDQVLVRDSLQETWCADFYSHYEHNNDRHQCVSSFWEQCIPYDENTAHLVGTNAPYKEPKPKVWRISSHGDNPENLTDEELSHFIRNAVILNKDITDVHIKYIGK